MTDTPVGDEPEPMWFEAQGVPQEEILRTRREGIRLRRAGWSVSATGIVGYAATLRSLLPDHVLFAALAIGVSTYLVRLGRRIGFYGRARVDRAWQISLEQQGPDFLRQRPFVLYLRPFESDAQTKSIESTSSSLFHGGQASEEEQLVRKLSCVGQVVAVGDPFRGGTDPERLPPPGCLRVYVTRGNWQTRVMDLLHDCRLAVMGAACSPGTLWELDHALADLPPTRLLLLVGGTKEDYDRFRDETEARFRAKGTALPEWPPGLSLVGQRQYLKALITFDDAYLPTLHPLVARGGLSGYRATTLEAALRNRVLRGALAKRFGPEIFSPEIKEGDRRPCSGRHGPMPTYPGD
ncbi:hypothetical protein VR41_12425 [Streptomyces sp. NRRL B-1568]|nr:hypothetical protein VR41_12425 [Streptomyces sp. NRRL B-1568]